jgi:hypothetical protein
LNLFNQSKKSRQHEKVTGIWFLETLEFQMGQDKSVKEKANSKLLAKHAITSPF